MRLIRLVAVNGREIGRDGKPEQPDCRLVSALNLPVFGSMTPTMSAKSKSKAMAGWGDLNIALNRLVKEGVILSYKTSRPEKDTPAGIEVVTAKGADQAEVVGRVRELLTGAFSEATVRTRTA